MAEHWRWQSQMKCGCWKIPFIRFLSPEGFASILWKDSTKAKEAAKVMKLTADDLKKMGVIECVLEEPEQYTVQTMKPVADQLREKVEAFIENYEQMPEQKLTEHRYQRFRKM